MKTFTWEAEVFAVGRWNDIDITVEDLHSIVSAFSSLAQFLSVPLKFGHNEEQPMTDGQPALGWVTSLRVDEAAKPAKLIAKFSDVPQVVYDAIRAKRYRYPSIELLFDVTHKGVRYPAVMTAVALLGADIPAVNVLSDLHAYMSASEAATYVVTPIQLTGARSESFSYNRPNYEESKMDIEEMKRQLEEQKRINAELTTKFSATNAEAERLKQEAATFAAKQKADQVNAARKTVTDALEGAVKSKLILPAQREALFSLLNVNDDDAVVRIKMEDVKALIDANASANFNRDTGHGDGDGDEVDASQALVDKAYAYMEKTGTTDFSAALTSVMRANRDLAERHVFANGVVKAVH